MGRRRTDFESTSCPFIDLDHPCCAGHFRLSRLQEVFGLCLGNHHACATYQRLVSRQSAVLALSVTGAAASRSGPARAAG